MKYLVAFVLLCPAVSFGWGTTGHRAVGHIADSHITKKTRKKIAKLLKGDVLSDTTTWADFERSNPDKSFLSPWHYCSVADGKSYEGSKDPNFMDIVKAIYHVERILKDEVSDPRIDKPMALRLLTHFVGDLHQPLHAGRKEDRGGNRVMVTYFGEVSNLHHVWDESIIDQTRLSFSELASYVDQPEKIDKSWVNSKVEDWANESASFRGLVYDFRSEYVTAIQPLDSLEQLFVQYPKADKDIYAEGQEILAAGLPKLSWQYKYRTWPVLKKRVLQGGIRLAHRLNQIFATNKKPLN